MMNIDPNGKLRGLNKLTLFTEKDLKPNVLVATVMPLYRKAFRMGVWQEDLSVETVISRLEKSFSGDFRGFFYYGENENCEAASWYEYITLEWIAKKSADLYTFAKAKIETEGIEKIIWHAETMVDPSCKEPKMGKKIKWLVDDFLILSTHQPTLVLTRMRDDNVKIIKINEGIGYQRTGITMPCSLKPETYHEFWYKIYT